MEKETEQKMTVNGFQFGASEDVEIAQQELSAIQYIEKKIENRNSETVLAVYHATLEKRLFRTPIGYTYLRELQKRLIKQGVPKEQIRPIPLYQVYNNDYKKEVKPVRMIKRKVRKDNAKQQLRNSVLLNVVLIILIIALFAITLTADNPNILNYRTAILNEYSSWEEELEEREQAVREKEREYNGESEDSGSR